MATSNATIGPIQPHRIIVGVTESGTGVANVQLPFVPTFVIFGPQKNANALSWAMSSTTSGLLKLTGRSATTADVVSFLAG